MADNLDTQDALLATLPTATKIAAAKGTFSGDDAYAGVGLLGKSTGAEGSRVITLVDPATEGGQTTGNASLSSIDGKTPALVGGAVPVLVASSALPSGAATEATLSTLNGKITAVDTGAVVVASSALPAGAATLAEQQTQTASLSVLDDWDESDRAKVNIIVGQAGVAGGSGVDAATVQRVSLATNVALPTGTNSIGQVTANAGTNLNTSLLALEAGGNLAAIAASASVLDDWDETDRAKVNLIVGQAGIAAGAGAVGVTVPRLTLASDDPAVAVLGAVAGAAIITDIDGTIQRYLRGLVKLAITAGGFLVTATLGAGSAIIGSVNTLNSKTILSKSGSAASNGNNTLVAAGTNKLKVFAFTLSTSSTTTLTVKFQDGAGGTDLWSVILQAPTGISTGANLSVSPPAWLFNTGSATLLNLNLSSANAVQWSVSYFDEA